MKCVRLQKRCHRKMKKKRKKKRKGFWRANKLDKFIRTIRTLTSYLPFGHCYFFKVEKKNSCVEMKRLLMNPRWRCALFIFAFHFSKNRQRYCNLACTKRKKERKKGSLVKFQKTEFAAINILQIFYWFGNQVLEMMMVERYLGA